MNKIYLTLLALFATLGAMDAAAGFAVSYKSSDAKMIYVNASGWNWYDMTNSNGIGYYITTATVSDYIITKEKNGWDNKLTGEKDVAVSGHKFDMWWNGTRYYDITAWMKVNGVDSQTVGFTNDKGNGIFRTNDLTYKTGDKLYAYKNGDGSWNIGDNKKTMTDGTSVTLNNLSGTNAQDINLQDGQKYYLELDVKKQTVKLVAYPMTPDYLYVHFSDNNWLHYEQCGNSQTEFQTVEINDAWFNSEGNLYFVFTSNGTYNSSNPSSNLSNLYAPSGTSSTLVTPVETGSSTTISINRATGSKSYRIEREANCKYTLRAHYKSNYGAVVFQVVKETISNPDDPINPDLPGLIVDTTIFATDVTGFTSLESWKVDAEGASTEHRTDELTANDNNKVKYFYNKGYQFNSLTLTGDSVTSVSTDSPLDPDHGYILYLSNAPADKKFVTNLQVKITNKTGGNVRYVDFHHVVMAETMEGTYTSDDIAYKAGDVIAGICSGEELLYPLGDTKIESGTALSIATKGTTPNSITSAVGTALESYYLRLDVTNLTLTLIRKGGNNDIQSGYLFLHYGFGDGSDQSNWNYTRRLGKDPDIFDVSEPFRVTEDTEVFFAFTESTRMFPWAADQVDTFCPDEPTDAQTWASDDPTRVETTETNGEGWSYWKFTAEPDRTYRWYATLSDPEYYTEDENPESTENNPIVKTCHSVRFFIIYVVDTPDDNTGFLIDQVNFAVAELEPVNQTIESCYIPTPVYGGDNLKTITTNPSHDMTYTWVKYSNEDISYNLDWKYYQCDTYIPETRNDIINKVIYYYAHTKVPGEKRNLTKEDVVNRPWAVHMNTSVEHDCRNFDDVYYRMYGEADVLPIITTPVETMGKLRDVIIPDNQAIRARVAYAVPVDNNTTGIEGITIDNEQQGGNKPQYDGAPEYYNLQGVRVMHPSAGQIYIVRRGSVVTKEIIR